MKRFAAIICMLALLLCGCGAGEETTVTGMVMSVEGTQITLVQMNGNMERPERSEGQQGERPAMPEGETMPQGGFENFGGNVPEGEIPTMPEGEVPTFPEGEMPTMPEGERPTMPEGGFGGRGQNGGDEMETTTIDLADAHITVEFEGGKATGSMEDITRGVFVTVTLVDGKATNAVVSENSGFGGKGGFGGRGQGGNRRPDGNQTPDSTTPNANT